MRLISLMLLCACATSRYAYEEMTACPASMSEQEHLSGVVRCRAMCSSYARDFAEYSDDCKCYCAPAPGVQRSFPQHKPAPTTQM